MNVEPFTNIQKALTLFGLAPAFLVGCAVSHPPHAAGQVPAAEAMVSIAVPSAVAAPRPAAAPPASMAQAIDRLVSGFDGIVGVGVTSIDGDWSYAANGDRPMPQQSVSKLWVAMTVLDAIDHNRLSLDTAVTVRREDLTLFHQPIATLVGDDGYQTTVRELLRRAMTMSDNTANDRLLHLVGGPDAVRGFIAAHGLGAIRFGPGERLLQSGTAGLTWRQEYSLGNAFQLARSRLPMPARVAAFDRYVANPPDGASAAAISRALARLARGELLSPTSTQWLMTTMEASHTGRMRLRGAVPPGWRFGHKTGTGQDLQGRTAGYNDVGFLIAPDGKSYAIAVMIGMTGRPIPARQELMQAVVTAIVTSHAG